MKKPKFEFKVATVGDAKDTYYVLSVNDGWYTAGQPINRIQRNMLKRNMRLRATIKHELVAQFWRFLGAA